MRKKNINHIINETGGEFTKSISRIQKAKDLLQEYDTYNTDFISRVTLINAASINSNMSKEQMLVLTNSIAELAKELEKAKGIIISVRELLH